MHRKIIKRLAEARSRKYKVIPPSLVRVGDDVIISAVGGYGRKIFNFSSN